MWTQKNSHVIDYVDGYLHGLLTPEEEGYVQHHCKTCRICQVALEEARVRFDALQAAPTSEVSPELIHKIVEGIKRDRRFFAGPRKKLIIGGLSAVAAGILLLVGLPFYYENLKIPAYDLKVYGQKELFSGTRGSIRVQVMDRKENRGVKNIPVEIALIDPNSRRQFRLASFETDRLGTGRPVFELPEWKDGEYQLNVRAKTGWWTTENISGTVKLKRDWKIMLTTDKPVYQPGQSILMRSLSLRVPDLKPLVGQETVFSVTDPKGNVIYKFRTVTSKFGIASTACSLAEEILEGTYLVQCMVGEVSSRTSVEVKRYVLPKFNIAVELDRPYYQPGDYIRGKVRANYFFGKFLSGGQARVELRTTAARPESLAKTQGALDQKGRTEFEIRVPSYLSGRGQESGDARIAVDVTVIDPAGQEQVKSVPRAVTNQPLKIDVILQSEELLSGVPNTLYLYTRYADGRPARTRLSISGIKEELTTSELGIASFVLVPNSEETKLTIRAVDPQGLEGHKQLTLTTSSLPEDFILLTDKAVYRGGQTITLTALGQGGEPVFVDLIKDGQTILTETMDMKDGKGDMQFDIPAEVFGTIQIVGYRLESDGWPIRKTRIIYVHAAKELSLQVSSDRPEYRPGTEARLNFSIHDAQGNPSPGAVSLSIVDEAVFSVLSQAPGMEKTFFALEEDLLKPIYALYPWLPGREGEVSSQAREDFERILFLKAGRNMEEGLEGAIRKLVEAGLVQPEELANLDAADVDELVSRGLLSDNVKKFLQGPSFHSLSASSFPEKDRQIRYQRERIENTGRALLGYLIIGVVALAGSIIAVWIIRWLARQEVEIVGILIGLVFLMLLIAILLPALGRARESSRGGGDDSTFRGFSWFRSSGSHVGISLGKSHTNRMMLEQTLQMAETEHPDLFKSTKESGTPSLRVRQWFPETLFWRPELITDNEGKCSVTVPLADSITTWRLTAGAVNADGNLGGAQSAIRAFQPFFVDMNLPVALTRGDEVSVPIVVYNYLEKSQTVELTLEKAGWFDGLDNPRQTVNLNPGEVKSVFYRILAKQVGRYDFKVTAKGQGPVDAITRSVEILPDGRKVERVFNGILGQPVRLNLTVPREAIEGSVRGIVKIYPSSFSQMVEGLEGIFQMPSGCFEQTSSTTYPNVLALEYLRRTNQTVPEVEAKARQYIHLGYQRLLSFEVKGGGFDWFGNPPGNRILSAYGLMEFEDMAKVHDVDPNLIRRTREWLMAQRMADGSWAPEGHTIQDGLGNQGFLNKLATTAYIAWAVYGGKEKGDVQSTLDYFRNYSPDSIRDPYVLALVCNAFIAMEQEMDRYNSYLVRLVDLKEISPDGTKVRWNPAAGARTAFFGSGRAGAVETTALAALAFIRSGSHPDMVEKALAWLIEQKGSRGTWYSTQATVLALKALTEGTGKPLGKDQARRIEIGLGRDFSREIIIPADQSEVVQQIDLSAKFTSGENTLSLTDRTNANSTCQVVFRYHVPQTPEPAKKKPLSMDLTYDRSELAVHETLAATAVVVNHQTSQVPMVILELPIPPGFGMVAEDWERLLENRVIAKYQITPQNAIIYLRELEPDVPLKLTYRLRAIMPVKVTVPPAKTYEYYNPDNRDETDYRKLTVRPTVEDYH